MSDLPIVLACWDYDRTRPLIDGRVKPAGIALTVEVLRPQESFRRMLTGDAFQAAEMSFSTYLALKSQGDCPFVALPVTLSKMFRHDCVYVRQGAGVAVPADLAGKRVGAVRYSSTGLIYVKGFLQHDFDVAPEAMRWFLGGLEEPMRAARPPEAPAPVQIALLRDDQTLVSMLAEGELDALISLYLPTSFLRGDGRIARLFPNFKPVEIDYYQRTGILPIMHVVVIRADAHRANPWIADSLYSAFVEAKDLAVEGLYDTDALRLALPFLIDHLEETRRIFGADFHAYGLEANRVGVAALCQYAFEQGLTGRLVSPDELFLPVDAR